MTYTKAWVYLTRTIPAWSVCLLAVLLVFSFIVQPYGNISPGHHDGSATPWQLLFSAYTVALHIMSLIFPLRVCLALGDVTRQMAETSLEKGTPRKRRAQASRAKKGARSLPVPLFVIILPAYNEEMSTLEETLRVLAWHPQARHCYHLYLAMEEKEEKSDIKATALINSFEKFFYRMSYTLHPHGIPGEAQGKSSNESWAAKQASRDYSQQAIKQHVIMTVMDADTHLSARYFTQISRLHLANDKAGNDAIIYVPPIVFDRNLHCIPLAVRISDLMWAGAGLSSLYTGSNVCIPTSVYSLPMTLVDRVGGWDTDPGAIGEDMHMYLKCFFALSGNLKVRIIYAAASQCNVSSDLHGIRGYLDSMNARYRQGLRHMWGSLDTGFAVRETVTMIDRYRKASTERADSTLYMPKHAWDVLELLRQILLTACSPTRMASFSSSLHKPLIPKIVGSEPAALPSIHIWNVFTLYMRLFEAHMLPIHLSLILTTSSLFDLSYSRYLVPEVLRLALSFSGWCRLAGWTFMLCFFWQYNCYHQLCVRLRQEEMRAAGMLEEMQQRGGFCTTVFPVAGFIEAGLFPIGGFIFGAIPALQAALSHIFTDRLVYVVSLKPQFAMKRWRGARL